MNPDFPQNERAKLEAKLTALLLGELHADEIAELSAAMEKDPELAASYERLKVTIELVREGAMQPKAEEQTPLKLSSERREKLLAQFKTVTPKEFAKPRPRRVADWLVPLAAAAVIVIFFGYIAIPNFTKSRETAKKNSIVNNLRLLDGAKQQWALDKNKSGDAEPTMEDLGPYLGRGGSDVKLGSIAGEIYVPGKVSEKPKVEASVREAKKLFGPATVADAEVHDGKVRVSPLGDAPATASTPAVQGLQTLSFVPQRQSRFAPIGPAEMKVPSGAAQAEVDRTFAQNTQIVLPEQMQGAGAAPPQMTAWAGNAAPTTVIYGGSSDVSKALKELADKQTNALAFSGNSWGVSTGNKVGSLGPASEFGRFKYDNVAAGNIYATNGISGGVTVDPASHNLIVNSGGAGTEDVLQAIKKLDRDPNQVTDGGKLAIDAPAPSNRVAFLGDVPMAGRLFRSGSTVANANESFNTALTRDDVNGLRYLYTNAVVASQLTNDPEWIGVLEHGEPQSNSSAFVGRYAYVTTPPTSDGLITSGLRAPAHVGGVIQGENRNAEIVLPPATDGLEIARLRNGAVDETRGEAAATPIPMFGGGGGGMEGGGNSVIPARRPSGGKQVEIAAAANSAATARGYDNPGDFIPKIQSGNGDIPLTGQLPLPRSRVREAVTSPSTTQRRVEDLAKTEEAISALNAPKPPEVTIKTKYAEVNLNDSKALGFDWYLRNYVQGSTNRNVVASGGTMPAAPAAQRPASNSNWYADSASVRGFYDDKLDAGTASTPGKTIEYAAAKEQLDAAKQWRETLSMKKSVEAVDTELPKARMVSILDSAKAASSEKPSLGQKIKEAFSGKVERTAIIEVEQEHPDIGGLAVYSAAQNYDPYFRLTEFETIRSHAVLSKAIDSLKLKDEWAKKYNGGQPLTDARAEELLKGKLDLHNVRNTKKIEIGVESASADEAARIANAVAQAYRDYRAEKFAELKNQGIESLQRQIQEQDKQIEVAQAKVDQLAKELNNSGTAAGVPVLPAQNDSALPKPTIPPPTPQPEVLTRENSVSTFSLNVSDVSFKLAAASLTQGQMPEPASIRSEEFINAFDYRDPEARDGAAIAFASERARYPFAQNRELLRFSLKTAAAGRQTGRPLNIVLLLDNSGSMERADRVRIIQEALRVLAGQLQASDTFSIVTFARTAQLRVDGIAGNQAAAAAEEIAKLTPEGGTNLGDALELAYETARHHYLANGDNRVVLLTDGAANLGDVNADTLKQKVVAQRQQGIALDCFGIGWEGYNDDLLEVLTRNGDGRYGFINTPEAATTEFAAQIAGALHVAASDVKVQVEFNPKRVTSYRQIGYAKHQLTKEQFRDNTVDAAEIAAQEAGNALYTIEVNAEGDGSIATVRVRYKVPGTAEYREQAWDVPYTGGAVALDQASPAMRLAATASAFSEWLATSPFAAEVSTDQLLRYLSGVPQVYGADARPAKLEWMIRQARSISGK